MSDQQRWTALARENPYWAVLAEPKYRSDRITPEEIRAFFATGETEVSETLSRIRRHIGAEFQPGVVIDYGSGLGRLTIPLARICDRAIGVDVSEPMLNESRRIAISQGIANVEFVNADAFLNGADSRYRADLVHSYIVLQHVHPRIGMRITETLLRRLNEGGVAALHYTFARRASAIRRMLHKTRQALPPMHVLANVMQGKPLFEPAMPMHEYRLTRLLDTFRRHGAREIHVFPTDHGGHVGAMFIFRLY